MYQKYKKEKISVLYPVSITMSKLWYNPVSFAIYGYGNSFKDKKWKSMASSLSRRCR